MNHARLDKPAIQDLKEDAVFFSDILRDCGKRLMLSCRNGRRSPHVSYAESEIRRASSEVSLWFKDICKTENQKDAAKLYERKNIIVETVHQCLGIVGQIAVSSHWQSPAVGQSGVDQVGNLNGKIIAHFNDYTRDQHVLGVEFEKRYRDAYIRVPRTIPVYAYATSSGMAAMTTAALMILGETPADAPVLLGTSCYFETKQLIKKMFGARVYDVDLADRAAVSRAVREHSPVAVFADTIGNEPEMRVVDGHTLTQEMRHSRRSKKYIVLDTSASAHMHRVVRGVALPRGIMLIGVESQNKLLQFGFDRVTAGVVWGTGYEAMLLYDYRDHAGTICPDVLLATLPTPNTRLANTHIRRIERNTIMLADILRNDAGVKGKNVKVVYPTVHGFRGAYFMLSFFERPFRTYDHYIQKVMKASSREGTPLVHGTSFGFHTTRLYTVAKNTSYEHSFLRISPGTETEQQILEIGKILSASLSCMVGLQ